MMPMTVYLGGGGTAAQEQQVWRLALHDVDRLLYWPFALSDDRLYDAEAWLSSSLASLKLDAEVETWHSLTEHSSAELTDFDLLFIGGGSTSRLTRHIRDHKYEQAIHDFLTGRGHYFGGSAGAVLAADSIEIAALIDEDAEAIGVKGLGLIPEVSIFPHSDLFSSQRQQEVARTLGKNVLLLPEASGVMFDGETLHPIGPDAVHLITPDGRRSRLA